MLLLREIGKLFAQVLSIRNKKFTSFSRFKRNYIYS